MLALMKRMPRLTPRKKPQQDRSRALVAAMHEATRRVLLREGFQDTTVVEIARVAGVSPGSVYQYFPTKESIISALHVSLAEDAVSYLADNLLEARDAPLPEVAGVIAGVTLQVVRDDREVLVVLAEASRVIGTARKLKPVHEKGVRLMAGFLASRKDVRANTELAAWMLLTALHAVMTKALHGRPELLDDEAFFDELRDLTHHYLRPGPHEPD